MKVDPVHYYYKDITTEVEMSFTRLKDFGWTVGFPKSTIEEAVMYKGHIPWPELTAEQQAVVDANYVRLYEEMEKDQND